MRIWARPNCEKFGEAGRSGAGDDEVGGRVGFLHFVMERTHVSGDSFAEIVCRGEAVVAFAGEVDELNVRVREEGRNFEHELVDPGRTLAAAHDEKGAFGRVEVESGEGFRAVERGAEVLTDGGAGDFAVGLGKLSAAGFEAKEHVVDNLGRPFVGFAGDGIRLVDEGRDFSPPRGEERGTGGKTAHPEDSVGLEVSVDRFALRHALPRPTREADDGGRENGREADGRELLGAKVRVGFEGLGVDGLLGNEEEDLVAAVLEGLGDGETGEEMAAGAAAGDDYAHGRMERLNGEAGIRFDEWWCGRRGGSGGGERRPGGRGGGC